jgi:hypothetical protein
MSTVLAFLIFASPITFSILWIVGHKVLGTQRREMRHVARNQLKYNDVYAEEEAKKEASRRWNAPPAPPTAPLPSLSTRLTHLDDALQAGLITQQDFDKKRADIIASA